jgi:hypothetical protein
MGSQGNIKDLKLGSISPFITYIIYQTTNHLNPMQEKSGKKRNANLKQRYLQPPLIAKQIPPSLIQIIIPSIHLARKLAKSQRQTPPNAKLKIGLPPKYQANKQNQENFLI